MPRKKIKLSPKKELVGEPIKATLKSVGRVYHSEGTTLEEVIRGIKISGGAKAVSVLTIEHGDKKKERILSGRTTHHLFGQGSPTAREIHLKKVKMLFDLTW